MNQDNGGVIGKINTPTTTVASGVWSIQDQFEAQSSSIWPLAFPQTTFPNSCRFNKADTDYLSKTFSGDSNRRTFTYSCWVKKCTTSSGGALFGVTGSGGGYIWFLLSGTVLYLQNNPSSTVEFQTTQKTRDLSAFMHILLAIDTTQSTSTDRVKLYINGEQVTSFSTSTYPSLNQDLQLVTGTNPIKIGEYGGEKLDAYLSEVIWVDGQQLTPTSFGATNPVTNIWEPIAYTGTYGTNGFKLNFSDSSNLGDDTSGNGNDFTVNNLTSVDQSTDTPSNNFATLNALNNTTDGNPAVYSEGNLKFACAGDASGKRYGGTGTIGVSKGKWYWEVKAGDTDGGGALSIGITHDMGLLSRSSPYYVGGDGASFGYHGADGNIYHDNSSSSYGNTYTTNDIIGVALDVDNSKLYFSKNGVFQNSGDPTSGSTGTGAYSIDSLSGTVDGVYVAAVSDINSTPNVVGEMNFGSPPYSISSGNADANGHGNFEYAVPSGYFALCTKNLSEFG